MLSGAQSIRIRVNGENPDMLWRERLIIVILKRTGSAIHGQLIDEQSE
jgi:hypothetical protein